MFGARVFSFALLHHAVTGGNPSLIEQARQFCPYTTFCTKTALLNWDPSYTGSPCCAQCSCDTSCWLYNNCCPDATVKRSQSSGKPSAISCRNTVYYNGNEMHDKYQTFRVTDSCPVTYTDYDVKEKCGGVAEKVESLDDIVVVSRVDNHDAIYRNRYCAQCHGIKQHDLLRWDLVAWRCSESMIKNGTDLRHDGAISTLISECELYSQVPADVKLTYKSQCNPQNISTCNKTGSWQAFDSDVQAACHNSDVPMAKEFFARTQHYRNVFCYMCNGGVAAESGPASHTCKDYTTKARVTTTGLAMLLNIQEIDRHTSEMGKSNGQCGELKMYDPILEVCRDLICPPMKYPYYSTCRSLSTSVTGLLIKLLLQLTLKQPLQIESPPTKSDPNSQHRMKKALMKSMGLKPCSVAKFRAVGSLIDENNNVVKIKVALVVSNGEICSFDYVADRVRKARLGHLLVSWNLNSRLIQASISIDHFARDRNIEASLSAIPFELLFADHRKLITQETEIIITYQMSYCAHIALSETEYANYTEKVATSPNGGVAKRQSGELLAGFISPNQNDPRIYACTDDYLRPYMRLKSSASLIVGSNLLLNLAAVGLIAEY